MPARAEIEYRHPLTHAVPKCRPTGTAWNLRRRTSAIPRGAIRVPRCHRVRRASTLDRDPGTLELNHWALGGDWTSRRGGRGPPRGRWTHRVQLPRTRSASHPHARSTRRTGAIPSVDRRRATRCHARARHRRPRQRRRRRTADVPANPTSRSHRGSTLRDRVPRPRRRGVCIYLRMSRGCVWTTSRRSNN